METKKAFIPLILALTILSVMAFASAISVNADYIKIYPGDQGSVRITVDNTGSTDIEDVSLSLQFGGVAPNGTIISLPFSFVGSSEKSLDDLDTGDDDSTTFTLKASTDITPGDYNIPYILTYTEVGSNKTTTQTGTFGLRVSARTDLDFSVQTSSVPIQGKQGQVILEIINKGLGDIKSVSVQVFPNGYDLLSADKVFIGTIKGDDSDTATYDVVYKSLSPTLSAQISYKDFDNNDQTQTVTIPFKVYTEQQAKDLGLITTSNTFVYVIIIIVLLLVWYFWRRSRKKKKQRAMEKAGR